MLSIYCPKCGCHFNINTTLGSHLEGVCPSCRSVFSGSEASPEGGGFLRLTVSPPLPSPRYEVDPATGLRVHSVKVEVDAQDNLLIGLEYGRP